MKNFIKNKVNKFNKVNLDFRKISKLKKYFTHIKLEEKIHRVANKYFQYFIKNWKYSQDQLEKSFQVNENDESLLKQSNIWITSVTWVLIGTSSFSILWLCFAKTEEVIVSTGRLEPKGKVHEIRIPSGGVAEKLLVKAGDKVKTGQILIQLDPESSA
ncbi:MAG: hypothetical protein CMI75_04305, partial [Candidatus Pelagibacter sp.]|nr:hypothetical protein [Candidatus Pelagibacter sp.]